jgi:tetratricopeptide (TPR) repeat protein
MTASDTTELSRAGLMIELGRFADATRLLAAVLAAAPDSCRGWCLLARAQLGNGKPAEALTAASRASALDPANDWPFRLISTALISLGRGADAVPAALEARRLAPHSWRSHVCLAQAAAAGGQLEFATEAAQAGLAVAPDQADVHVTAGRVALSRGDVAEARLRQEAALAIEPTHSGAINELGRISLQMRDPATAAEHFLRAARTSPGNGIFGRNSELALRYLAIRLARPILLAAALCAAIVTLLATGYPAAAAVLAPAEAVLLFWAASRIRAIPRQSRRHLPRLVRARLSRPAVRGQKNNKSSKAETSFKAGTSSTPPAAARPLGSDGPSSQF